MQRTQEESCRRFCHLGQLSALPRLAISGPHGAAWPPWAAGRAFPSRFHEPPFCRRATANHRGALGMQRPLSPGVRSTSIPTPCRSSRAQGRVWNARRARPLRSRIRASVRRPAHESVAGRSPCYFLYCFVSQAPGAHVILGASCSCACGLLALAVLSFAAVLCFCNPPQAGPQPSTPLDLSDRCE